MAYLNNCAVLPLCFQIILLLIISYPSTILSQDPSSSSPNIAQCTANLLPLIPCAPFVQGTALSPGQQCCDNVKQLYGQEPHCLCPLLNDTSLGSFPINRTLALQLPALCSLQVNVSDCPGEHIQVPVRPTSPASPSSFGTRNNSTVAASPAFALAPRSSMMGFGFGTSHATSLKAENRLEILVAMAIVLVMLV